VEEDTPTKPHLLRTTELCPPSQRRRESCSSRKSRNISRSRSPLSNRARELLDIGAERGLKNLFCEAVHALNDWRGQWSPLPLVPEKCSTDEILDLLEQRPHWFVQSGAATDA